MKYAFCLALVKGRDFNAYFKQLIKREFLKSQLNDSRQIAQR